MVWILFLVCSLGPAIASDRVALVIGNSAYEHVSALPNPGNDARAIGQRLQSMDFDVELVVDADLSEMRRGIAAFGERAAGAEVALVFYAGHGMQDQGTNFLLPTDVRVGARDDLGASVLRVAEIYDALNRAAPETAILILDACRDNPFSSTLGSRGLTSGSVSAQNFVQRPNSAGMIIAFAAAPGAVAFDGADGNSPYTTALLQWIDRPGMELATIFRRVRGTVLELTNGAQVPWVEEALVRDVVLNPGAPEPDTPDAERIEVALREQVTNFDSSAEQRAAKAFYDRYLVRANFQDGSAAPQENEEFVQEGLIWLSIRESEDQDVFQVFIDQFPNSPFTPLARQRIEDLSKTPVPTVTAWLDNLEPVSLSASTSQAPVSTAGQVPAADPDGRSDGRPTDPATLAQADTTTRDLPRVGSEALSPAQIENALDLTRQELAAIQMLLSRAGVYQGPADADYGPGTRGGIKKLQEQAGLPATGTLNVSTLRQIVGRAATETLRADLPEALRADIHRVASVAARGAGASPRVLKVAAIKRNDAVEAYWREIADDFQAENPDTLIEFDWRPGWRYKTELMSMLGSETPPDLIYTWSGGHLDALRDAGFARDITLEMASGWALEFKPSALQTYTDDGQIHGAPMQLALVSLYANREVLDRAGISPGTLSTWQGFLAAVQRLKAQGITPLAIGGKDRWPFHHYFASLAQRIGGQAVLQDALNGRGEGFLAAPFLAAGQALADLAALAPFQDGYLEMDDGQAVDLLAKGEVAMILAGNWRLQKMRWAWPGGSDGMRDDLLQLDFPSFDNKPRGRMTLGGADGFAVHSEAPDSALAFMRRLTDVDVQERMAELASDLPSKSGADLGVHGPFLPAAANALLSSSYHQLYLDQELGPVAGEVLTDVMTRVGSGRMTANDAMASVEQAWDLILDGRTTPAAQ